MKSVVIGYKMVVVTNANLTVIFKYKQDDPILTDHDNTLVLEYTTDRLEVFACYFENIEKQPSAYLCYNI